MLDINEFPPELASPYETFVCENAKVGQVCLRRSSALTLRAPGIKHSIFSSMETSSFISKLTTVDWSVVTPHCGPEMAQGCCWKLYRGIKLNLEGVGLYGRLQRLIIYPKAVINTDFVGCGDKILRCFFFQITMPLK